DPRSKAHVGQAIDIMKQLPLESGPGWSWVTRFVSAAVAPNGKGILFTADSLLVHADVEAYAKLRCTLYRAGVDLPHAQIQGSESGVDILSLAKAPTAPHRDPDYTIADEPLAVQVLLHRLLYDISQIDTRQDDATDFGGPMADGMSTFALGSAARAIVDTVAEEDQRALTFFRAHIESKIHAEDQLETRLWLTG
ncbi:uncharacterized protein SCHCODRAFT_02470566, partial [Schizophyllum commune H4-8]|uniref:uncharacterized protein n=1 Tax=Schizophyllum commune (strain H4-8 / FGSC 9210) TaxID=578458 RepID=UPI00215DDB70